MPCEPRCTAAAGTMTVFRSVSSFMRTLTNCWGKSAWSELAKRAFVLAHERSLGIDLLLGDRILLEERVVALEVEPRVLEERAVARELSLGLLELHLERSRIDLGEERAFLHQLAFLEQHAHELA